MELPYELVPVELPARLRECVLARDWTELDQAVALAVAPGGVLFETMRGRAAGLGIEFREIEFIIAIRSSREWRDAGHDAYNAYNAYNDEDGIWHDDGSRVLAFSLSLTLGEAAGGRGQVEGGRLEMRRRSSPDEIIASIPTPPYGTMIIFQTGHGGYEHRIRAVTGGERIIIAGWAT